MRLLTVVCALASLLLVASLGCSRQDNSPQTDADRAKDAFVKSLQETVDSLQDNIDKLGTLASAKGSEAKAKYDKDVKPELDKKLDQAKSSLNKVKSMSGSAWETTKAGAQAAVDDLKAAYDRAVKMF